MRPLRVTPAQSSSTNTAATIDDGATTRRLGFEFSVPAAATGDFALPLSLFPSMALGAPLHVDSPVDPALLAGQERIQSRLSEWEPAFSSVPVIAPKRPAAAGGAMGVGLFFSGGLDSFCALVTHRDQITHLILIHGFDVQPSDTATRKRVAEMARAVADELELVLIEVATDAKAQMQPLVKWGWYHAGLLAGIGHALEGHLARVLIASSYPVSFDLPWGQHVDIDHLWSTPRVGFETADPELTRPQKCQIIGESEQAMRWLRVCWRRPHEWNCGRCVKCVRTMVDLQACGRLGDCRTFPDTIDVDAVRAMVLDEQGVRLHARTTVDAVRASDADDELADAVELALRRAPIRTARRRAKRLPAGVIDRARYQTEKIRMRLRSSE